MFGRRQALKSSPVGGAALTAALSGVRPVAERLLYDDDLRDNIRTFIESARKVLDELSDEDPSDIVARLWDDDKLRKQVEAAVGAAQEGTKRVRGERIRRGGSFGRRFLLLTALAGGGYLFLSPRTGPEARRIAKDAIGSLRS